MAAKTSRKPKRKAPKYHRLTREQRIIIETLRKEGYSIRPIAVRLGVSPATVSRKLRRNRSKKGYRNRKADAMARHRARQKAGKRRKLTEQMWSYAMEKVRLGWSFAMACGRAGRAVVRALRGADVGDGESLRGRGGQHGRDRSREEERGETRLLHGFMGLFLWDETLRCIHFG